jgi:hypothetical protein
MLIQRFINTLPNIEDRKLKLRCRSGERRRKKEQEEGRKLFQNKRVSSQNIRMRKEEGATVAATPYLLSAGRFEFSSGRTGSVLQRTPMTVGKGHKLLKMSY